MTAPRNFINHLTLLRGRVIDLDQGPLTADDLPSGGYQLQSDNLDALAGLSGSSNTVPYFTGPGAMALFTITPAGATLLIASTSADQRSVLGLDTTDSPIFTGLTLAGNSAFGTSTGWAVTVGYTTDKNFDPESTTLTEVARNLGTLIDALKAVGIIKS